MNYDVILIHPPAIYDFREKAIFYGPIALTVPESTRQFIVPPVGMLSIADYLDNLARFPHLRNRQSRESCKGVPEGDVLSCTRTLNQR